MAALSLLRLATLSILALLALPTYAADQFTPSQKTQVETIIHDYLLKNPQLIMESVEKLRAQEDKKTQQQVQQTISKYAKELFHASTSPVLGNANGDISVIVFSDYQCPYCKRISPMVDAAIKDNKNLRVVFKELPVFGENSEFAARAALAAQQQGKYLNLHEGLMQSKGQLSNAKTIDIAKNTGLDMTKLKTDMSSDAVADELKRNLMLANALQLSGTPAFIVAKTPTSSTTKGQVFLIPGAIDQKTLQKVLDQLSKG